MSIGARLVGNLKRFFRLVYMAANHFIDDGALKYSASLSYYTIFSVAPMLIIAIAIASFIFGKDAVNGHLFGQINHVIGNAAALQVQEMLSHTTLHRDNAFATITGVIIFIVGATGVFGEIQSTINRIWGLKARPNRGFVKYLFNRLLSFAMVVSLGFLLVVSLVASTVTDILSERLSQVFPATVYIMTVLNHAISLSLIALLFALIFKFLPDSIVKWKDALVGSFFTSVLFMVGKYLIGLYMSTTTNTGAYGAAGSLIVIVLWIYYSSILLYFGAEFTRAYALTHGHGIRPNNFSVRVEYIEKEIVH
jgi:membrane protein